MSRGQQVGLVAGAAALLLIGAVVWLNRPGPDALLLGDSILRQTAPALREELDRETLRNEAVNGSGLLTPTVFDWEAELPRMLEEDTPEVAVVLFIGNYTVANLATTADGTAIQPGSPAFFEAWGAASERIAVTLLDAGVQVRWVLPPPMLAPANETVADGLRQQYEALAQRHPEIVLVDGHAALGDDSGRFLAQARGEEGAVQPVRALDGVHLEPEGARRLAQAIAATI